MDQTRHQIDSHIVEKIVQLRNAFRACSVRMLANACGVSPSYVQERLGVLNRQGLVEWGNLIGGSIRLVGSYEVQPEWAAAARTEPEPEPEDVVTANVTPLFAPSYVQPEEEREPALISKIVDESLTLIAQAEPIVWESTSTEPYRFDVPAEPEVTWHTVKEAFTAPPAAETSSPVGPYSATMQVHPASDAPTVEAPWEGAQYVMVNGEPYRIDTAKLARVAPDLALPAPKREARAKAAARRVRDKGPDLRTPEQIQAAKDKMAKARAARRPRTDA